jgi:O-antigen/teichoic acid export membrane protein
VSSFIFLALLALTGLTIAAYPLLARYLPDYSLFAILTVYYTIIVAIKAMFDVIVRGMQDFKTQAFARIFEIGVVILAFSLIFLLQRKTSYSWFIAVITIGAIFISAYYFLRLSKYFGRGDKSTLLQLLVEGKLFFVSALLGTIFLSTDRLVVAHYLDIRSLGIYSAYYLSSFGLITQAIQLFTNVFFPASARVEDKSFARKIDRLFVIGFIPLAIAIGLMMLIMLSIFGRAYPVNYLYVIEFTVFSCLYFFLALYNTVILDATHGIYKKYLILANAVSVATIIFYGLAVAFHFISIAVIVAALAANSLITIVIQRYFISRMQQPRLP